MVSTEEWDVATPFRNPNTRRIYQFIQDHRREYPVETGCRILEVAPSGYYVIRRANQHRQLSVTDNLLVLEITGNGEKRMGGGSFQLLTPCGDDRRRDLSTYRQPC